MRTSRSVLWRRVKQHRSYTVDEAARQLGVAKGTVRRWLKAGLCALPDGRPILILGSELAAFLKAKAPKKQRCRLDECYCFTCRAVRPVAGGMADLVQQSAKSGNLQALCAVCTGTMHKRISLKRLPDLSAVLDLTIRQAGGTLEECRPACPNDHLPKAGENHA